MVLTGSAGVKAVFLILGLMGFFLNFLVYVARVLFLCIGVRVAGVFASQDSFGLLVT